MSVDTCPACGWDPRGSDRFHRCGRAWSEVLRPGTQVEGPAKGGGVIRGLVLETRNGPSGLTVLVKWAGHRSGEWTSPNRLALVTEAHEAA